VWLFGSAITQDLDEAEERIDRQYRNAKGKGAAEKTSKAKQKARQQVLHRYLNLEPGADTKGKFADPASLVRG
jgi:hypothetical protein